MALVERWNVLDKTISLPDDDLADGPSYLELSDGEEEESTDYHPSFSAFDSPRLQRHSEPSGDCTAPEVKVQEEGVGPGRGKSYSIDVGRVGLSVQEANCDSGNFESSDIFSNGSLTNTDTDTEDVEFPESTTVADRPGSTSADDSGYKPIKSTSPTPTPPTMPTLQERPAPSPDGAVPCSTSAVCTCDFRRGSSEHFMDTDGRALLKILEFPSRVFATRQPVDLETLYPKYKRIILRDVLRTDRNYHFFRYVRGL